MGSTTGAKAQESRSVSNHARECRIKFGTDGWRAEIADDYTFANVRRCAQGFASYLQAKGMAAGVVIGYDKRFSLRILRRPRRGAGRQWHPCVSATGARRRR